MIIKINTGKNGSRPPLQDWSDSKIPEGFAVCLEKFIPTFTAAKGFVNIIVENGVVTTMTENIEAKVAWEIGQLPNADVLKLAKLEELSKACNATITAGCDVTLSDGTTGHISMKDEDQINLMSAIGDVQSGASGAAYHLDGTLCRIYSAADIAIIAAAAKQHKLYHTTYCNHLNEWVRRCETVEAVQAITYGSALPDDLAANFAEVLGNGK